MYQAQQTMSARRDLSRPLDRSQGNSPRKTTTSSGLAERPTSPTSSNYATEAHIHRIRNAALQSNYKVMMCKVSPTSPTSKRDSKENNLLWPGPPEDEECADADDVESVDWTAPLKNVQKSEYAIKRQKGRQHSKWSVSKSATVAEVVEFPPTANATQICPSELPLPQENGEKTKRKLLEKYLKVSKSKPETYRVKSPERTKLPYIDYNMFVKGLSKDIQRMKSEMLGWDFNSLLRPRKSQKQLQKESFERAYSTMKKMYELNPHLTESAARKCISGPPGNHWMGLSRMQVVEAMEKIREEMGLVPKNFGENILRPYARIMEEIQTQKKNPKKQAKIRIKKSQEKRKTPREKKQLRGTFPRAAKVPTRHIPGPAHLHTNICIRPWEPSMDGWSQGEEIEEQFDQDITNNNLAAYQCPAFANSSSSCPTRPNSVHQARSPKGSQSTYEYEHQKNSYAAEEDNDEKREDDKQEKDFVTLEIFNPFYRIHH